ncbi:histidine phosphatase superfamily [Flagelloscypha sp. PMI_526]|nr:histidine phosphatase superfamily [Flagelloscypha sp. PMI_526]
MAAPAKNYTFEPVLGFFAQDNTTAPGDLGAVRCKLLRPVFTPPRFGLIDDSQKRWSTFFKNLHNLNCESKKTSYKLFILGRHGQGYHNVAEAFYGTEAWDDYWSKLNGNGTITWGPDAELTDLGKVQAEAARALYNDELTNASLPIPSHFYTSPLTRAMDTHDITFQDIEHKKPKTLVVENCREVYGEHTCDKRRTKTFIHEQHPQYKIEKGFTEEDELWTEERETDEHAIARAGTVAQMVFSSTSEDDTLISITAHSGFINSFLQAVGREKYSLPTGGILPVIVKATVQ